MPVERSVLVWISEAEESRDVAECFLRSFRPTEILPFFAALKMSLQIADDLKSLWLLSGLKGGSSAHPCMLCKTERLKKKKEEFLTFRIKMIFIKLEIQDL